MAGYKRRIFLINKPFQFRFSLYVCSWLIALTIVYPLVIHSIFSYLIRYVSLDPFGPPLEVILSTQRDVMFLIITFQVIFALVTFLISIFVSHRIAGPLYKLQRYMAEAARGSLTERLFFRKTDYFQEIAQDFNRMTEGLRGLFARDSERAAEASRRIENALKHVSSEEGRRELQAAHDALREIGKGAAQADLSSSG